MCKCKAEGKAEGHLEEVLGIQQAWINLGRGLVSKADHKDFGGCVTGCCRLSGNDPFKKLIEGVQEGIVILRPACTAAGSLFEGKTLHP